MAEETTAAVEEERELASQPIPGLVRKYTIITGQGMLAQIIMVVLEGLVMGWGLGAHGLACVSIIMSVEYINLAFGNLFGTGVPAVVGNLLGAGDIKGASKAFSQGFWLTTIVSVLLAVVMAVFTEPICAFFGATPDIMADTVAGVRTFSVLLPLTVIGQMVTAVMRVDESSDPGQPHDRVCHRRYLLACAFHVCAQAWRYGSWRVLRSFHRYLGHRYLLVHRR